MNLDISALGYHWRGIYSPYLSYRDGDVVFKEGGAWVIRQGQPQPFALGQQDAILKGHLLTGGISVGGIGSMALHSNGADGVEFRFMADRNGTIAAALMNTDRAAADRHSSSYFMAAIMNDGSVRAWGRAVNGQQGTGNTGDIGRTFPARTAFPPGTPRIVSATCVWDDSFFLDADGGLWHAGGNEAGLASGVGSANPVPRKINGYGELPSNAFVKRVFTGHDYFGYPLTFLKKADKTLWACGAGAYWGNANGSNSGNFVQVPVGNTVVKAVHGGTGSYNYGAALLENGTVYAWGYNGNGALGLGDATNRSSVELVRIAQRRVVDLSSYGSSSEQGLVFLLDDGQVLASGYAGEAQLPEDDSETSYVPYPVIL